MTNELKNLLILLLSVTLSVSCHKESPAGPDESRIITVCTDCDKMTRSGGMTPDGLKEKYFYLLIDQTDEAPDYFVRMVWDGTGWKPEDNTLMEAATGDLSGAIVTALFYDSQVSLTMEEFRTQSSYRLEYGGTSATGYSPDILYATNVPGTSSLDSGAVEVSGTAVNIRFAHAMSRLKFDCSQDITVSRISISGMADSFTWNAATNGGYASGISTSQSADIALTGDVYECFIVPQTVPELTVEISYTDNSDRKSYRSILTYTDIEFRSGVSYVIGLPAASGQNPEVEMQ